MFDKISRIILPPDSARACAVEFFMHFEERITDKPFLTNTGFVFTETQ